MRIKLDFYKSFPPPPFMTFFDRFEALSTSPPPPLSLSAEKVVWMQAPVVCPELTTRQFGRKGWILHRNVVWGNWGKMLKIQTSGDRVSLKN